jgi:hypothetical protein
VAAFFLLLGIFGCGRRQPNEPATVLGGPQVAAPVLGGAFSLPSAPAAVPAFICDTAAEACKGDEQGRVFDYGGWPPLCEAADGGDVELELWLPPPPIRAPIELSRAPYAPTWPSTLPPPPVLVFAVVRSGTQQYGSNVFADGQTVTQSLRCPADHGAHHGHISLLAVEQLRRAARRSHFADSTDAYDPLTDSEMVAVAFYDDGLLRYAYGTSASMGIESLMKLANEVDQVLSINASVR